MSKSKSDRVFLEKAFINAARAHNDNQIPVGCIIVNESGMIIGSQHNQVRKLKDRTAHAEMLSIREAMSATQGDCVDRWTLYTTLEPCPMCISAIILCRIGQVVWAASDPQINTLKFTKTLPYEQKNKTIIIACPFKDIEQKCFKIYQEGNNNE